jgi:hypothetical protein
VIDSNYHYTLRSDWQNGVDQRLDPGPLRQQKIGQEQQSPKAQTQPDPHAIGKS